MRMHITIIAVLIVFGLIGFTDAALAQQGGTVPGGQSKLPLTYYVSGATFPPSIAVEQDNLHRYDNGSYISGATIELWGTAHHNYPATSTVDDASFRATISYTERGSNRGHLLAEDSGKIRPGTSYDYRISASIPTNAHQVRIAVVFGLPSGHRTDLTAYFVPAETTSPPTPGQPPSEAGGLAGEWAITADPHPGRLVFEWTPSGWTGSARFESIGRTEPLRDIRFDPATGRLSFTRVESNQPYSGTLSGNRLSGEFVHLGQTRPWSATFLGPQSDDQPRPGASHIPGRFTVEAGKRTLSQGGSVTVPVSLNNVDGLANMNVNVHYDPAVVRPIQNAARGNIIPQALFETNVRDRGVIRLGFAQQDDIRGTGTLAQIPFEAVGRPGTRTTLRLEVTMASAAAGSRVTPAQLIHGEIMIVGADGRLPGDTSGEGNLTALDAMNALKMSVGNLPVDMVADMDRDGQVTARDATLILQEVVGR